MYFTSRITAMSPALNVKAITSLTQRKAQKNIQVKFIKNQRYKRNKEKRQYIQPKKKVHFTSSSVGFSIVKVNRLPRYRSLQ
jgi:hypothetical protein